MSFRTRLALVFAFYVEKMVEDLSLSFKLLSKTKKGMKKGYWSSYFCQISHMANEEEAFIYRQIGMWQNNMNYN